MILFIVRVSLSVSLMASAATSSANVLFTWTERSSYCLEICSSLSNKSEEDTILVFSFSFFFLLLDQPYLTLRSMAKDSATEPLPSRLSIFVSRSIRKSTHLLLSSNPKSMRLRLEIYLLHLLFEIVHPLNFTSSVSNQCPSSSTSNSLDRRFFLLGSNAKKLE